LRPALLLAALLAIAAPGATPAQGAAAGAEPEAEAVATTGDAWVDARLADMDTYAARYRGASR
jgi:hypothetical protein